MKKLGMLVLALTVLSCGSAKKLGGEGDESTRFNRYMDAKFDEYMQMFPEWLADFGKKERYNELNDRSEAMELKLQEMTKAQIEDLKTFDPDKMDPQARLTYELAMKNLKEELEDFQWRYHGFPINQQGGLHTHLPVFMINIHKVDNEKDLQDYIARLGHFKLAFDQTLERVKKSAGMKIIPPKFVFPYVYDSATKVITGAPFDKSKKDSPLYADFKAKLKKLKLPAAREKELTAQAEQALMTSVKPAYESVVAVMKEIEPKAPVQGGAWTLPRGADFYKVRLKRSTTTDLTADQVHELGLKNVERLRNDMITVKNKLGYKGDLLEFFKVMRKDPKQYYPDTEAGRKAYIKQAEKYLAGISKKIPEFFRLIPKTPMEVKAVEKFREASAGKAFYDGPSDDGSRPGKYYVNLSDMKNAPKFEAEALLYHEGIPGHHFQIALGIEQKELPKFRRYNHYGAFVEGWALYTERLGKDMGGYKDLHSELGRLSMEMIRACRLVVDTGLHHKRWTREQGIEFFSKNLPVSEGMQVEQVERYIIWPGQATSYMVGMLKIQELRDRAQQQLGNKFDMRDFHDVVIGNGSVPLDVLEKLVNTYVSEKNKAVATAG